MLRKHLIIKPFAGVAELVDALDSGSSVRKDVRVQLSPSAPLFNIFKEIYCYNFPFRSKINTSETLTLF